MQLEKEKVAFKYKFSLNNISTEGTLAVILMILFIALTFSTKDFLTLDNFSNLFRQAAVNGIVALGMTFVIISAGIDLSVGSVVGFSGIAVSLMMKSGYPVTISIFVAISISIFFGILNGIIIYDGHVPPFIATLGTMAVIRGIVMLISSASMIGNLPKSFVNFAQINILGIPSLCFVWIIFIVICIFIARKTIFGRNVYAIGSSQEVARLSGINIRLNIYAIYALCAFLSAVAGILMTSRLANGIPTGGQSYEMDAIAACVIGGASLMGAEGTILGTVLGAIIMAVLRNGGNLLGVDAFVLQIVIGALIVDAVFVDQMRKVKKG